MTDRRLGKRSNGGEKESIEPPVSGNPGADHVAWMKAVAGDILSTQPLIQLAGEEDVAQLRVVVRHQRNKA